MIRLDLGRITLGLLVLASFAALAHGSGKSVITNNTSGSKKYAKVEFNKKVKVTSLDPDGQFSDAAKKLHVFCWGQEPYQPINKKQSVTIKWTTTDDPPITIKASKWTNSNP